MLKFKVKNVIKEEQLVVIVVEPIKQSLLLEKAIPPGCIQHIISNIKENKKSKDICVKMCDILCNINMDDKTFRTPFLLIKFAFFIIVHYFPTQLIIESCSEIMAELSY